MPDSRNCKLDEISHICPFPPLGVNTYRHIVCKYKKGLKRLRLSYYRQRCETHSFLLEERSLFLSVRGWTGRHSRRSSLLFCTLSRRADQRRTRLVRASCSNGGMLPARIKPWAPRNKTLDDFFWVDSRRKEKAKRGPAMQTKAEHSQCYL